MPRIGPAINASGNTPAHAISPQTITHRFRTGSRYGPTKTHRNHQVRKRQPVRPISQKRIRRIRSHQRIPHPLHPRQQVRGTRNAIQHRPTQHPSKSPQLRLQRKSRNPAHHQPNNEHGDPYANAAKEMSPHGDKHIDLLPRPYRYWRQRRFSGQIQAGSNPAVR
jgi:hypothetical protein